MKQDRQFEPGYTGDGFTHQSDEDAAEQEACERAVQHIDSDRYRGPSDWDRECQESRKLNRR